MAAMSESVNAKVLSVLVLITVLLVLVVTIGMQAFVRWAQNNDYRQKQYGVSMPIEEVQTREQQELSSLGYSVERDAYRIPIEQAMELVEQGVGRP